MSRADYDALEFHVQLDFFLSETSERADVVLPSVVWAEDAGVATNAEGRIVLRHRAADPPGEARPDWWILCEIVRDPVGDRDDRIGGGIQSAQEVRKGAPVQARLALQAP